MSRRFLFLFKHFIPHYHPHACLLCLQNGIYVFEGES